MLLYLDQMQWLTLLVWLGLLLLYLGLLAGILFSTRRLHLGLSVSWSERLTPSSRWLRSSLLGLACAILAMFLLQVSPGESTPVRVSVALIGAAVGWLFLDWATRQFHAFILRRSAEARDWALRSAAATSALHGLFDRRQILERACLLLRENLRCRHVYLFELRDGAYHFSAAVPAPPVAPPVISSRSLLQRELSWGLRFRPLPLYHPQSAAPLRWSAGPEHELMAEQATLDSLAARVAVPLQFEFQLAGFFLLGALDHGHAYGPHHLAFAEAIARQVAQSLADSSRAVPEFERVAEAAMEQASRRSARAARTHLAPPDRFQLPDLDFAAAYWLGDVPAGAYYDILSLPGRAAAFFLAEIPGPFEEAAVRLVQLQALLRTRARAYHEDLAELADSTRRAIALSAASRPPISLFCARFVSGESRLKYLNAGIYPPIHLRRTPGGAQIVRLTTGRDPIEAQSAALLEEGEIDFLPGDLLAIASSGIPAAAAPDGSAWGEGGLVDALLDAEHEPAADIAHRTLAAAAHFTSGSPQQPPRVLLVLRRLPALS
jgi:hypothetical protein